MAIQQTSDNYQQAIKVRLLDFIEMYPTTIKSLSISSHCNNIQRLYICRQLYSEICNIVIGPNSKQTTIQSIKRMQPAKYLYEINDVIVMVMDFELRISCYGQWKIYPFTTQLISSQLRNNKLYTFHEKECLEWVIEDSGKLQIKHLQKQQTPFYINNNGILQGQGKTIKSPFKGVLFTVCQSSECMNYLFIGCDNGKLLIYETRFLTLIHTFHRHHAAILCIKSSGNMCYFSGSDSKISSITVRDGKWHLCLEVRGQSHDILALETIQDADIKYLISGGVTTDLCFYRLCTDRGQFQSNSKQSSKQGWFHKISYSSEQLLESLDNYVIVNKISGFQIWEVTNNVELLVEYIMPGNKIIRQIRIRQWSVDDEEEDEGSVSGFCGQQLLNNDNDKLQNDNDNDQHSSKKYLIFITTNQNTVSWIFNQNQGIYKHLTVNNVYDHIEFTPFPNSLLALREGDLIELLNYRTGKISEIAHISTGFVTDIKMRMKQQNNRLQIVIGSKFKQQISVYEIWDSDSTIGLQEDQNSEQHSPHQYQCKQLKQVNLKKCYDTIDLSLGGRILVKYFGELNIVSLDLRQEIEEVLCSLPENARKIRFSGWIIKNRHGKRQGKKKAFWYAATDSKIYIVSNLKSSLGRKKIRVKQMPRIGHVIARSSNSKIKDQWDLSVVPLDFRKYITQQPIQPIITKKIL